MSRLSRTLLQATYAFLAAVLLFPLAAAAAPRVALVVGNNQYAHVTPLQNAAPDARLMAERLRTLGFDVVERIDATRDDMISGIEEVQRKTEWSADVVLVYVAAHGVQINGVNYLLPTDVRGSETSIRNSAIPADFFLSELQGSHRRGLILILDACRDDPFLEAAVRPQRGLAEINIRGGVGAGALIAYATSPGATASDGDPGNGPYARALADAFDASGLAIEEVFRLVSARVAAETADAQTPWMTASLKDRIVLREGDDVKARAAFEVATEAAAWRQITGETRQTSVAISQIEWFLNRFPAGFHAGEARARLASLRERQRAEELARVGADAGFGVVLRQRVLNTRQGQRPAMEVTSIAPKSDFVGRLLVGDFVTAINNVPIGAETAPMGLLRTSAEQHRNIVLSIRRGEAVYDVMFRKAQ